MISMVVFDMAGTTVDEDNIVYKTLQRAINDHGNDFTLEQVMAEGAGKEKLQAIQSVLKLHGIEDEKISREIYQHFIILLNEAYTYLNVKAQPHAVELFHHLRQQKILVVLNTGYQKETALTLIEKLGWEKGDVYDELITASDVKASRPYPDMILLAMEKFRIKNPDQVIKIGDSITDIEEGKNALCTLSIGITTGAHSYEQLLSADPDYIISDLLELQAIIEKANGLHPG